MARDKVVLVTGGAGFLGQHIVKHLMERAPSVSQVRVFDLRPYSNTLGHAEQKPLQSLVGNLSDEEALRAALRGVNTVIHAASLVSYCMFPDMQQIREVNVEGTRRIINLCLEENVENLVYTSTVDVVISRDDIIYGNEDQVPRLSRTIYPAYGDTKSEAEGLVVAANGSLLANGRTLHSLALRPTVMYGEEDPHYISELIRQAKRVGPYLVVPRIGGGKLQQTYVGNVAWAHVVAMETMSCDSSVGGEAYFVTDDTPVANAADFAKPIIQHRHHKIFTFTIPSVLMFMVIWLLTCFARIIRPIKEMNLPLDINTIIYISHTYCFSRKKLEEKLGYKPLYDVSKAITLSLEYYKSL